MMANRLVRQRVRQHPRNAVDDGKCAGAPGAIEPPLFDPGIVLAEDVQPQRSQTLRTAEKIQGACLHLRDSSRTNPSKKRRHIGSWLAYVCSSAVRRPHARTRAASLASRTACSAQWARPSTSPGSTIHAFCPCRTRSIACPTRVVTRGTPLAIDSSTALGPPSWRDVTRYRSNA